MSFTDKAQRLYDTFRPNKYKLKPYLLDDGKKHPFAIICPGGGYSMVCSFVEGKPFAEKLNECGYHAFVVYYRTKEKARYPHPQEDLKRAIEEVFSHADEWNLDTESWSLWGSSAGGHLVASYCTENWETPKPSALILVYPVITMGNHTHTGSRDMLLGKNATEEMINKLSVERQIDSQYPATYIWYGTADETVEPVNTKMLETAFGANSVEHKIEEFDGIGHGAGLAKGTVAEIWFKHAIDFCMKQK